MYLFYILILFVSYTKSHDISDSTEENNSIQDNNIKSLEQNRPLRSVNEEIQNGDEFVSVNEEIKTNDDVVNVNNEEMMKDDEIVRVNNEEMMKDVEVVTVNNEEMMKYDDVVNVNNEEMMKYDDVVNVNNEKIMKYVVNVNNEDMLVGDGEEITLNGTQKYYYCKYCKKIKPCYNADYNGTDTPGKCIHYHHEIIQSFDTNDNASFRYPFVVSILRKFSHHATGVLLNHNWILTTAGEFYNVRESIKLYIVRLGSVNCKTGGVRVPLKAVYIHPSYIPNRPSFDIALLKLAIPVNYTDVISSINLAPAKEKLRSHFMTLYWPRLIIKGQLISPSAKERFSYSKLRVTRQQIISDKKCSADMVQRGEYLNESGRCLVPIATDHSICTPDAGAPVVTEAGLWGITSGWISENCSTNPSPTVFTLLSPIPIRTWLYTIMSDS